MIDKDRCSGKISYKYRKYILMIAMVVSKRL